MCHGFRSTICSSVLSLCSICSKNCRMDTEVLDLIADDESGVQKQKSTYHWDKKSKKFVKLNRGEKVSASGKVCSRSFFCQVAYLKVFKHYARLSQISRVSFL
jgi:hypothetical protein